MEKNTSERNNGNTKIIRMKKNKKKERTDEINKEWMNERIIKRIKNGTNEYREEKNKERKKKQNKKQPPKKKKNEEVV